MKNGFTIIEVLITTFIIGTVITGLFGLFLLSLRGTQESEKRLVAVALAQERMDMVRNLPYAEVGTSGGIPSGAILQEEIVDRNGLSYTVKTDIRYVDDDYDGEVEGVVEDEDTVTVCHKPGTSAEQTLVVGAGALNAHLGHGDTTGACESPGEGTPPGDEFNSDYKQVRVEVTWPSANNPSPVLVITYTSPPGIENSAEGGTLDLQVLSASGIGLPQADVRIVNTSLDPAYDYPTVTNNEGRVVLPGLPAGTGVYELFVSKENHTSDQTFGATATFTPNSDHSHISMIARKVIPRTFLIDLASELILHTQAEDGAAIPTIAYRLHGMKTIGSDENDDLVYAVDEAASTDAFGDNTHSDIIWDQYNLILDGGENGYDIKETSRPMPLAIGPGENADVTITLVPHTDYSLQVTVVDAAGNTVNDATLRLFNGSGYDETLGTGIPGQVIFSDIPAAGEYTLEISAPGFAGTSLTVTIAGTERAKIELGTE